MKKVLLFFIAIILFSCNNQPDKKEETNKATKQKEIKQPIKKKETNLPPKLEKHSWYLGQSDYTGTYDANKYTKEQLENTYKYLIFGEEVSKPFSIFSPKGLKKIDKSLVENKFNEVLKKFKTLEFVDTEDFRKIKQKRIKELERIKLLSLIQLESYSNPKVLLNDNYSKEHCSEYTNALIAGGDELLAMRKKMAEKSKKEGNGHAWNRYIKEMEADNRLELARIHVSTFGWWNCVNNSIERLDVDKIHEANFKKLFTNITEIVEEP